MDVGSCGSVAAMPASDSAAGLIHSVVVAESISYRVTSLYSALVRKFQGKAVAESEPFAIKSLKHPGNALAALAKIRARRMFPLAKWAKYAGADFGRLTNLASDILICPGIKLNPLGGR
jgi:hypothetical protein